MDKKGREPDEYTVSCIGIFLGMLRHHHSDEQIKEFLKPENLEGFLDILDKKPSKKTNSLDKTPDWVNVHKQLEVA